MQDSSVPWKLSNGEGPPAGLCRLCLHPGQAQAPQSSLRAIGVRGAGPGPQIRQWASQASPWKGVAAWCSKALSRCSFTGESPDHCRALRKGYRYPHYQGAVAKAPEAWRMQMPIPVIYLLRFPQSGRLWWSGHHCPACQS